MTACTFCGGTGTVTNAASWVAGVANAREDATCPRCGGTGKGPVNSRRKGSRGEREFIDLHLSPYWPEAGRNLTSSGRTNATSSAPAVCIGRSNASNG